MSYSDDVIQRSKLNKQITISPFAQSFRWCNNDCDFCYLKTTMFQKPLSKSDFKQLCINTINWFDEYAIKIPEDVNIMILLIGGELYCLDDEYYKLLEFLIEESSKILKKYDRKIGNIGLVSNLLLSNDRLERFHKFYEFCKTISTTDINTSYDIEGRFKTKEKVELWYNNFSTIANTWNCNPRPEFEMVLTKSSILKFINNENCFEVDYFKKALNLGYKVDFCTKEYQPNSKENIKLVPSNEDLFLFFKKLIDDYGTTIPLFDLYDVSISTNDYFADNKWHMPSSSISFGLKDKTDYDVGTVYDNHGVIVNYCNIVAGIVPWAKNEGNNECKVSSDSFMCVKHPEIVKHYFNNIYGCGICKYKAVCDTRHFFTSCYAAHQHNWGNKSCYIKHIFKYVEDKKNVV